MELGVYTFAELPEVGPGGLEPDSATRLRDLLEEAELADQLGLDVFGVGEHHRPDFAVSAPAVVLAAIAERTKQIRLTSAVSVISSDDPVRVFEEFATLDLLSGGRAEIMAGRGSFIESFPLFGYDLDDYDSLFAEKLELLLRLRSRSASRGRAAPSAAGRDRRLSASAAGAPGLGRRRRQPRLGRARRAARTADGARDHRRHAGAVRSVRGAAPARRGAGGQRSPALSINSHGYIAETSQQALDESFPAVAAMMNRIGRERGWTPMARHDYDAAATKRGANFVGSPQQVIEKILFQHEIFGHDRFLVQFSVGTLPHAKIMRSIELFGTEVAPAIRQELGS